MRGPRGRGRASLWLAYQRLAKLQTALGADYFTLNIDGTQSIMVRPQQMFDFLPDLIPAIQEATDVPISFDNPSAEFHRRCLEAYDRSKSGRPILNSVAASRQHLDEMLELVAEYDTMVIGMASEKFVEGGSGQCMSADDVYGAAQRLVEMLRNKAGRTNDQIIIDPGSAPVGADTYGLVNMGLDAMRLIRGNPDLAGVHLSVGLTNFSFGIPKSIRENVESCVSHAGGRCRSRLCARQPREKTARARRRRSHCPPGRRRSRIGPAGGWRNSGRSRLPSSRQHYRTLR